MTNGHDQPRVRIDPQATARLVTRTRFENIAIDRVRNHSNALPIDAVVYRQLAQRVTDADDTRSRVERGDELLADLRLAQKVRLGAANGDEGRNTQALRDSHAADAVRIAEVRVDCVDALAAHELANLATRAARE